MSDAEQAEGKKRAPPPRHPSTLIPDDVVREAAYRLYLWRLDPSMTPEQSVALTRTDGAGKVVADDAKRRRDSAGFLPLVRDMLRALVDMGLVVPILNHDSEVGP